MQVDKLLERIEYRVLKGSADIDARGLSFDNRAIEAGDVFVCIKGVFFDTHEVISEIASHNPSAIVISSKWAKQNKEKIANINANVISVGDTRKAKACISAAFYGYPSESMTVIGITGSKGKTSTAHMLTSMLVSAGKKVGMVGTTGGHIDGKDYHFGTTTPDSDKMQEFLSKMKKAGCEYAVIEASSQGLKLHRTYMIDFDYGVFLNIEKGDHVSPQEHESFEDYLYCKSLLMKQSKTCVVNGDDPNTPLIIKNAKGNSFSFGSKGHDYDYEISGIYERIICGKPCVGFDMSGKEKGDFLIGLPGEFNVVNAAAAIVVADLIGIGMKAVKDALSKITITGRLDMIYRTPELSVCIDYAHNGLSTRNLLKALRAYEPKRIICVFGCGGDRDLDRRPEMGKAAGELADLSIITSEHNRFEKFEDILKGIKQGIDKTNGEYLVIEDRKEAIKKAIMDSKPGDLVAILGIGNDGCLHDHGKDIPHDDIEYSREVIGMWQEKMNGGRSK